jgi:hypothetical protein
MIAMGAWAYSENYAMRARLAEAQRLRAEIAALNDAIATQRAEWAFLNRPDRLRALVDVNFGRLHLMPMEPGQLAPVATLAYPAPAEGEGALPGDLDLSQSVDVQGTLPADPEGGAP